MTTTTGAAETAHPSGDDRFEIVDKHLKRVRYEQDQLIETLHVAQDVFGSERSAGVIGQITAFMVVAPMVAPASIEDSTAMRNPIGPTGIVVARRSSSP